MGGRGSGVSRGKWGALELSRETALSHVDGGGAGTRWSQCPVQSGGRGGSRGLDLICFWTLSAAPYLLLPPTPHWRSWPVPHRDLGSLSHGKCPTLTLGLPNPVASGKSPSLSQPPFHIYRMGISIATSQD